MGCTSSTFPSIAGNPYRMPSASTIALIAENGPAAIGHDQPKEQVNPSPVNCDRFAGVFTSADYEINLSATAGFPCTLGMLSVNARAGSHTIRAQHGLTTQQICCSLLVLCNQILEPIWARYPGFTINSGFRHTNTGSDHEKGIAADISWPAGLKEKCEWARDTPTLRFWQLIYEKPPSSQRGWMHVSYNGGNRHTTKPPVLTWAGGNYLPGIVAV